MSTSTIVFSGRVPMPRGAYDPSVADYTLNNLVTLYGMSFIANGSVAANTPPAQLNADGTVSLINTSSWSLFAGSTEVYNSADLLERLKRDLGYRGEVETVALTAGQTGKYVKCATRAAASNNSFNISAPFNVDACSKLLIKTGFNPSDSNHSSLDISIISIYEELERVRTVQAKDSSNNPLYYVVDEDGNPTEETTTVVTDYPVYTQETYTETRYLPNNEDRYVEIPDSGYYVANIPQSCKVVISYKPGVTDLSVIVVKHGDSANLTSQVFTVYDRQTVSEALMSLAARIEALEEKGDKMGAILAASIDSLEYKSYLYPVVLQGAGAPSASVRPTNIDDDLPWDGIPVFIGQIYMDMTNKKVYRAFGFTAIADWVALN